MTQEVPTRFLCEEDARIIAEISILKHEALERHRKGEQFAREMERAATVLDSYLHKGAGDDNVRFLRHSAKLARNNWKSLSSWDPLAE